MRTATRLLALALLALGPAAAIPQGGGNPALPCYHALAEDPRLAPIRGKVALGGSMDVMRRMTTSADRASQEEKPVLAAWRGAREVCHRQELPYYATRDNEIAALAGKHFAAVQALIAELQDGKLTYGEFGRRRIELYETLNRQVEDLRRSILPPKLPPRPPG